MSVPEVCNRCGYENPSGFKFCKNCGRSRNPRNTPIRSRRIVEIHEKANMKLVAEELWGDSRYIPAVADLREAVNFLSFNRKQIFISVMNLHLPGVQVRRTYAEVAKEQNSNKTAVHEGFTIATYLLTHYLNGQRTRALYRRKAEDDPATAVEEIVVDDN